MIDLKKRWRFVGVFALVLVLTGWISYSLTRAEETTAFDFEKMKEAVVIRLDQEPKLQSPIRTFVAAEDQGYTLFFQKPMDRDSVEEAIYQQAEAYKAEHTYTLPPKFTLDWKNDQELHLTAHVPTHAQQSGQPDRSYIIDVNGAKTKSGQVLAEAPTFNALLALPKQLWRISLDGKVREPLTKFGQPYDIQLTDPTGRYLLLSRYTEYCGCDKDRDYQKLYLVYDTSTGVATPYPVQLQREYTGSGTFIADPRGFFYSEPPQSVEVPGREDAVTIDVLQHVHGAVFSKDRHYVLMIVESEGEEDNNSFIVYNLKTKQWHNVGSVIRGKVDQDTPVRIVDDGDTVYFTLTDPDDRTGVNKELGYQYSWQNETLKPWVSPVNTKQGVFLSASDDRKYRVYSDGSIFRGIERVGGKIELDSGYWVPNTHKMADIYLNERLGHVPGWQMKSDLVLFDADLGRVNILVENLGFTSKVVGTSGDGKWIYLTSDVDLHEKLE